MELVVSTEGRKYMNRLVVTFEEADMLELQAILIDRDEAAALKFLETRVAAKVPQQGMSPCDSTRRNPYLLKSHG